MIPLRQKMIEDMQLRGLSARTRDSYVRVVSQLATHYSKSPERISEAELRAYFLYLQREKQVAVSTCRVTLCGLKFLYTYTLRRPWPTLELIRPAHEEKLPVILSVAEVQRLLSCLRRPAYRVCPAGEVRSTRAGCGCWKGCGCGSIRSTAAGWFCTCGRRKGTRIGMSRCRSGRWGKCGATG